MQAMSRDGDLLTDLWIYTEAVIRVFSSTVSVANSVFTHFHRILAPFRSVQDLRAVQNWHERWREALLSWMMVGVRRA